MRFWLEKGVDGFRIDAVPHLVEAADFRDEPLSNTPGVNPNDYGYLDHIYTKDDELTYEIMKEWRQVLDDYTNQTNSDEKVKPNRAKSLGKYDNPITLGIRSILEYGV